MAALNREFPSWLAIICLRNIYGWGREQEEMDGSQVPVVPMYPDWYASMAERIPPKHVPVVPHVP